ncbi:hypothetical protein ACFX2F_029802 [Malus domestica]
MSNYNLLDTKNSIFFFPVLFSPGKYAAELWQASASITVRDHRFTQHSIIKGKRVKSEGPKNADSVGPTRGISSINFCFITDPTAVGRAVTDDHHLPVNVQKEEMFGCSPQEKDKD